MLYGAIEAGGTKFVCAVADKDLNIIDKVKIDTLEPEYTMGKTKEFFRKHDIVSLGIGSFGPVDIHRDSPDYGMIQNTPKIKWRNYNIIKSLKEEIDVPMIIDTDVNAAALGEYMTGHGIGKRSVLYITIGTGVGAGFALGGETLQGLAHPEMGHILVRQLKEDEFEGVCPSHKNCLEGLVAGPAIEARCGQKGHLLGEDHKVWDYVADYIGQALMSFTLILSPEIILIGGGVSQQEHIFPKIREAFKRHMNGYISHPVLETDLSEYIRYPKNGQLAGLYGSIQLAVKAHEQGR
jgi:fructokinase